MIGPGSSGVPSPYWKVLLLFLFPPVPYGHLLWVLSDGELQGTGWTTGLTAKSWPTATHDYYYEAHLFMFLDVFLYLGLARLLDLLLSDPLALRRPQGKSGDSGGDLELTSTTSDAAGIYPSVACPSGSLGKRKTAGSGLQSLCKLWIS
jgi:hypothetical protein